MNILIISNCELNPNQGSGYVICGFAAGLQDRGHRVIAFDPEDYILMPSFRHARRLRLFIGYTLKALSETLHKNEHYDIIELWGGVGWLSCIILNILKVKSSFVISRSNGLEPCLRITNRPRTKIISLRSILGKFESLTDRIGFSLCNTLTVVSKSEKYFAVNNLFQDPSKILLLENALTDNWLNQKIENRSEFTIGFVGGWLNRKGCKQLINVVNSLSALGSKANWIIAGVGPEGKRTLLQNTKLSTNSIHEQIERENLKSLYQQVSIFLCLSSYESFGLVCSEAMSCGCMLMSTKVGFVTGLRDRIDYVSINRDNIADIATKLLQCENGVFNYQPIAKSGWITVQHLDWNKNITKLEQHYMGLCKKFV